MKASPANGPHRAESRPHFGPGNTHRIRRASPPAPPGAASPRGASRGPYRPRGLLPALLCSLAALVLLELRGWLSKDGDFSFLAWNLWLAWIPYLIALLAPRVSGRGRGRRWRLIPLAGAFLLFLPNAPYIVTDFVHLRPRPTVPLWADIALLSLFAGTGWLLALLGLHAWKSLIQARFGRAAAWAFAAGSALACGFGIYLGRFLRWNSWDVLRAPGALLVESFSFLRDPARVPRAIGVTALFGALLLLSFVAFELLKGPGSNDDASQTG